jgi:hypothetical protein
MDGWRGEMPVAVFVVRGHLALISVSGIGIGAGLGWLCAEQCVSMNCPHPRVFPRLAASRHCESGIVPWPNADLRLDSRRFTTTNTTLRCVVAPSINQQPPPLAHEPPCLPACYLDLDEASNHSGPGGTFHTAAFPPLC